MLLIVCIILDGFGINLALALPLAVGAWSAIAAAETDADSPLNQTLFDKIRGNLDYLKDRTDLFDTYVGTRIKFGPEVFHSGDQANPGYIQHAGNTYFFSADNAATVGMSIPIPFGFKATHAMVYSDAAQAIQFEESDLSAGTTGGSIGAGNCNTEVNITDTNADTTNLLVAIITNASRDYYGGYVTIAEI
jgi:hypothetical protein